MQPGAYPPEGSDQVPLVEGGALDQWLRAIGLEHWVGAFRNHGITKDDLPGLTETDLREVGLTIGERKRFLRAVAALRPQSPPDTSSQPASPDLEATRAERRPMTMAFVDLVNSSAIAEQLEPEDLLEVIRQYREFCGSAIVRYGGHIARLVGDGILAYFCYPVAHENDPERSLRAALDIVRGIGTIATPAGEALAVRIGIATGRVIVSDLLAGGEDRRSIIGSTPNLAARLQGLAPADGIVIAEETHARVDAHFTFEDLGIRTVPGFTAPRHIWRVIGEAAPQTQIHPGRPGRRMTPFHGRHDELAILAERWQHARQGNGNAVLISGEAGIGKSRLIEHFVSSDVDDATRVVRLAASALDQDSPLYPVIAFIRAESGLLPDERAAAQLEKLRAALAGDPTERNAALPLLAELVGIPSNDPKPQALPPAVLRERILQVLVDQVLLPPDDRPLCLVIEDLLWLDPTSSELLQRLAESMAQRPIFLLLTARDGTDPPRTARSPVTMLRLAPLEAVHVAAILESLFIDRPVPPDLVEIITEKTDGVPLFVEEVARSLVQLSAVTGWNELEPLRTIPTSLDETLVARLDRSGASKQVAQIAAVLGRSVRHNVLRELAAGESIDLDRPLADLLDSGVLVRERAANDEIYSFRHALLRDAAYDSLLRPDRQRLHLRVAPVLQAFDSETIEQQPELLALHLTEGGQARAAIPYWIKAAQRSLAQWALTEATRMLRRGLAALNRSPSTDENTELRLQIVSLLGPALISLQGLGSHEAQTLYNEAYALCEAAPQRRSSFPIYWGWWRVSRDFNDSFVRARMLLSRANDRGDPEALLQAHHCNWAAAYFVGDLRSSRTHAGEGLRIYAAHDCTDHASIYGNHDPKVCAHGELAQIFWMRGQTRAALEQERLSMEWAEKLAHLGSLVHARDMRLLHRIYRREFGIVFREATEFIEFTSKHGLTDHRAKGLIFRGWAVAMMGDVGAGLTMLEEGLKVEREIAGLEDFPVYTALWAETLIRSGNHDLAIQELAKARGEFEQIGLRFWMPELIRLEGEAMVATGPSALTLFEKAMDLAQTQEAWMLRLRAAVSAARAHEARGCGKIGAELVRNALSMVSLESDDQELTDANAILCPLRN
jgi:class 3 adenylate cyclase/predicted ATPase